jgi:hypothetical protein
MAVLSETITALQFSVHAWINDRDSIQYSLSRIWYYHQRIALSSAILSSMWSPVIYYPLNRWWERIKAVEPS